MPKKLYEITIKSWKGFYVEADSEDDALGHSVVEDESSTTFSGDFDWEHDETSAKEVMDEKEAQRIRERHPDQVVAAEEDES